MTSFFQPCSLSRHLQRAMLAAVLVCAASGVAVAQSIKAGDIAPFEVVYEVGNNFITAGTARLLLIERDDLWFYSLRTRPRGVFKLAGKGNIAEESVFRLDVNGDEVLLHPLSYQYRQDEERRREVDATFDWTHNTVTHVYRGNEVTESFSDPVLDRLSVTLWIMNALRNDFESAVIPIFDTGKIKEVEFINQGKETLDTPLGNIETLRVVNHSAGGGSRETVTWFAPSLDYLPVKIEHMKRDELVARLSLISLNNRVTNLELGESEPVIDSPVAEPEGE